MSGWRLYAAMLLWNAVLVSAMVAEWADPLLRVATIMIAVVALGALLVRNRPEPVVVEAEPGRHLASAEAVR